MLRVRGCLNHAEQWGMPQSLSLLMAAAVGTGNVREGLAENPRPYSAGRGYYLQLP